MSVKGAKVQNNPKSYKICSCSKKLETPLSQTLVANILVGYRSPQVPSLEKRALFSIQQLSSDISVQYRHTILFTTGLNIFCAVHATSLLFFSVFLKNSKNSSGFLIFQWKRNSICYILYNNSFVLNIVLFLISSISYALCYCPTRVSCCMETSCCTAEGDGAVFRVEFGDFYITCT